MVRDGSKFRSMKLMATPRQTSDAAYMNIHNEIMKFNDGLKAIDCHASTIIFDENTFKKLKEEALSSLQPFLSSGQVEEFVKANSMYVAVPNALITVKSGP